MLATNPVTANLIKARELIADEKNWCRGAAQIGDRFCAVGALRHVRGLPNISTLEVKTKAVWLLAEFEPLNKAAKSLWPGNTPAGINDKLGHAAVMRMFDRAIALSLA